LLILILILASVYGLKLENKKYYQKDIFHSKKEEETMGIPERE